MRINTSHSSLLILVTSSAAEAFVSPQFRFRVNPKILTSSRSSGPVVRNLLAKDFFNLTAHSENEVISKNPPAINGAPAPVGGDDSSTDTDIDIDDEIVSFASDMRAQEQEIDVNGIGGIDNSEDSKSIEKSNKLSSKKIQSQENRSNATATVTATAESIQKITKQIQHKTAQTKTFLSKVLFHPQFGSRGELYLALQAFLIFSMTIGYIPFLKEFMKVVSGPAMLILGPSLSFVAMKQMQRSSPRSFTLSLQPRSLSQPESGSGLVTRGLFRSVRHPFYAGNIATLLGWSVVTGSVMRLLMTLLYFKVVEMMVEREEAALELAFGEEFLYYKTKVQDKYVPLRTLDSAVQSFFRSTKKESKSKVTSAEQNKTEIPSLGSSEQKSIEKSRSKENMDTSSDSSEITTGRKTNRNPSGLSP